MRRLSLVCAVLGLVAPSGHALPPAAPKGAAGGSTAIAT
jgi:hypothetical protein